MPGWPALCFMTCLYKLTPNPEGWTLAHESNEPMHFGKQWDALLHVFGQPHAASLAVFAEDGSLDHYFLHCPQQPSFING
jgi:hypothetical protein